MDSFGVESLTQPIYHAMEGQHNLVTSCGKLWKKGSLNIILFKNQDELLKQINIDVCWYINVYLIDWELC